MCGGREVEFDFASLKTASLKNLTDFGRAGYVFRLARQEVQFVSLNVASAKVLPDVPHRGVGQSSAEVHV
jgi:hypothetical protein